ncbi:unnamed protein product [Mycena citricolor]|uniref:endo-polygalacturonase n=1 Tax=Mycena citricolor TaxID=2018698 RepID=A0AAD2H0V9_9AGAR|nr:unnamed protein product [Mycena citricolor]CAK5266690.1 unnamed protein product [Mycena citricolor]CAK5281965.1 unnamed protein product [Mycena citricolor]CAK5281986.1 unnamed protein product [Mycena citricolor]
MSSITAFLQLSALISVALALPGNLAVVENDKRASCTVNSVASSTNLSGCSNVVIQGFTVPAGNTITITAAKGATVTMAGDVVFAKTTTPGPLFTFNTPAINFVGGNHKIDGNGASYWDGKGSNGGSFKPHPFIKVKGYGTFKQFTVLNSPAQAISVGTTGGASTISEVTVDNSLGDSKGGHNTDGFDVSADDVTISSCTVKNQDDCLALNEGNNIVFEDNTCANGHGISIGSMASGKSVTNFKALRNTVTNSLYGIRIKVQAAATGAKVANVVYDGNKLSGISSYGVLITQSYPANDGKPGSGGPISGVSFSGSPTTVSGTSSAYGLVVDCGACSGTWDFSGLDITAAGKGHSLVLDKATLSGGHY